jgi:hypothetical protein
MGMEKGFGEVAARRRNGGTLVRGLLERGFVPSGEFEEIEMINGREGEEFVQRCYHVVVLDIGQTADMQDEMPESIDSPNWIVLHLPQYQRTTNESDILQRYAS